MSFFKKTGDAMRYRAALARRAFADSLAFYGWGRKIVFLIVGPIVVGVVLRFAIDSDAVRPFVVSGVFGIAVAAVLFLLACCGNCSLRRRVRTVSQSIKSPN